MTEQRYEIEFINEGIAIKFTGVKEVDKNLIIPVLTDSVVDPKGLVSISVRKCPDGGEAEQGNE